MLLSKLRDFTESLSGHIPEADSANIYSNFLELPTTIKNYRLYVTSTVRVTLIFPESLRFGRDTERTFHAHFITAG